MKLNKEQFRRVLKASNAMPDYEIEALLCFYSVDIDHEGLLNYLEGVPDQIIEACRKEVNKIIKEETAKRLHVVRDTETDCNESCKWFPLFDTWVRIEEEGE